MTFVETTFCRQLRYYYGSSSGWAGAEIQATSTHWPRVQKNLKTHQIRPRRRVEFRVLDICCILLIFWAGRRRKSSSSAWGRCCQAHARSRFWGPVFGIRAPACNFLKPLKRSRGVLGRDCLHLNHDWVSVRATTANLEGLRSACWRGKIGEETLLTYFGMSRLIDIP